MRTSSFLVIYSCLLLVNLFFSCDLFSKDEGSVNNNYAKVTFINNTQFHVKVYRDTSILFFNELAPGESRTGDIQSSADDNVGTTFCFSYRLKISDSNDTFSGEAFAEGVVSDKEETFVIKGGKPFSREIPVPDNIVFNSAFIRIKNQYSVNTSLYMVGTSRLQHGNKEMMIPSGKTGIYKIDSPDFNLKDYSLRNVENSYYFPNTILLPGYIYDFIFSDEVSPPRIIPIANRKIKPEPTSTWKKIASEYDSSDFSRPDLNNHLKSNLRYGVSNWRFNYPVNKILVNGGNLVYGGWDFNLFDNPMQPVGRGEPFEMAMATIKDAEWNYVISNFEQTFYFADPEKICRNTIFNDIVKLNNNSYVILTTYITENRTGIWLFIVNANGTIINEIDIPPSSDKLQGFMGVKLCALSDGGFLVMGIKKYYSDKFTISYANSEMIIYKYTGNDRRWGIEPSETDCAQNYAVCAVETRDEYIVAGFISDDYYYQTIVYGLNKKDGEIIWIKYYGSKNGGFVPLSAVFDDEQQCIFISGLTSKEDIYTSKAFIMKLDTEGKQLWINEYGSKRHNYLFDIIISDNNLIAAGSTNDTIGGEDVFWPWQKNSEGWVLRIDAESGIVLEENKNTEVSVFNSVALCKDGGYVFAAVKNVNLTEPYWFNSYAVKANERLQF